LAGFSLIFFSSLLADKLKKTAYISPINSSS
jgi:hypothetical protein